MRARLMGCIAGARVSSPDPLSKGMNECVAKLFLQLFSRPVPVY
jgi:hypothetical protein